MSNKRRYRDGAQTSPSIPDDLSRVRRNFFLRTKLLTPNPPTILLSRPRLRERLIAPLSHQVTVVTANAGSGKTMLVADSVRRQTHPYVWYQLDHSDADPAVFLSYITHGLRQIYEDFGRATLNYLQQEAAEVSRRPEHAVDVLLNEALEYIDQPVILVLDDYHTLGGETPVHATMDRMLAYLPDVMRVIIISREMPPLHLTRQRLQSALGIINHHDLLLTVEELREFFLQFFKRELTPEQAAECFEITQGWITALQILRLAAERQNEASGAPGRKGPAVTDLNFALRQSEQEIFDYFAEEVLVYEEPQAQQLLMRLSLLDGIDLEICDQLYPEANCSGILPALVRRNVFITMAGDDSGKEYRLHPLFRSFLRRRMVEEIGQAGVAIEHVKIADLLLAQGNWGPAIGRLLEAGEFDRAVALIAEKGQSWIISGAINSLISSFDAAPPEVVERHPRALIWRAEASRLRGEYDAALMMLQRARILLSELGDGEGEAEALHSLATIARRRSDFASAFDYLDRAVKLTAEQSPVRTKCGNTRGLCFFAIQEWNQAEAEFRAALSLAEERGDEYYERIILHNLGLPAMMRGDFGEALRCLRRLLRDAGRATPRPQETTAHLNMARCYLYRGDQVECERHLESAMESCQLFNLIALRGEIFEAYGNLYRERGESERAREFYERAARAYEEAGIELPRRELLEEQALLGLQNGDLAEARLLIEQLISLRVELKDDIGVRTARVSRGRILLAQGGHEPVMAELEETLDYFNRRGLYYYEAQACLIIARYCQLAGRKTEMAERLLRVLELSTRYNYEYWLKREASNYPDLFAAPEIADLLPVDLRRQASESIGQPGPAETVKPAMIATPWVELTIKMIGPAEIFRDPHRPFAADAWTTRRAREILCYLASRYPHRVSKEMIIDVFWPDADPEAIARNFNPTMSHIRRGLNSNQLLKVNFLIYREGYYLLDPSFSYSIDTDDFEKLVAEADLARRSKQLERQISVCEAAVSLYRGEFMQGCYEDWPTDQRAYYREKYLQMLETLVVETQKSHDWSRSLQLAHQMLREEPFREDIHCLVMRAHAARGNKPAVKDQFEALRSMLRKEIDVEPAAETEQLYRQLLSQ